MASETHASRDYNPSVETHQHRPWRSVYHETMAAAEARGNKPSQNSDLQSPSRRSESAAMATTESHQSNVSQNSDIRSLYQRTEHMSLVDHVHSETHIKNTSSENIETARRSQLPRPESEAFLKHQHRPMSVASSTAWSASEITQVGESDSDDDSDDDFEAERFEFNKRKAEDFYKAENWEKTEVFILPIIKILEKDCNATYAIRPTNPDVANIIDWLIMLQEVQTKQGKWSEALLTLQRVSAAGIENAVHKYSPGFVEGWQGYLYYKLGDMSAAKRQTKKAIRIHRNNNSPAEELNAAIECMVLILKERGEEADVEFYNSLRVEVPSKAQQTSQTGVLQPTPSTDQNVSRGQENLQKEKDTQIERTTKLQVMQEQYGDRWPWVFDKTLSCKWGEASSAMHYIETQKDLNFAEVLFTECESLIGDELTGTTIAFPYETSGLLSLHVAACMNYKDLVKLLLEKGAKVTSRTKKGYTAMHLAIIKSDSSIVELLIKHGYPVNGTLYDEIMIQNVGYMEPGIPLHLACACGSTAKIKTLLRAGAEVDKSDTSNKTALMVLIDCGLSSPGLLRNVELLVTAGADVNASDTWGTTVLHFAASKADAGTIRYLVSEKADRYVMDGKGKTPYRIACEVGRIGDILSALK
ncbi:hypothetical protein H072_3507 [Dactylellina haptotyla CBS 200.50]|uniref:Uncharacterized protein n=1 Tax=Dactylellina haptotyla (strain CBS 200.50) TaxID=1284197 RepID=S8BSR6_DACHA|nr:hypothetical protein H072_3507 [Dactylellina haptotyla CBS 200.50]